MGEMDNVVGVGMSQNPDLLQACQEAAKMALDKLSEGESVAWALAFCAWRHDPAAVLDGLRSQLGEIDIIGGSAVGTITNSSLSYSGYEIGVAVFASSIPKPTIVAEGGLDKGETEAGKQLGARLREVTNEGDTVLLFYDSLRSSPPPVLNVGSRLMDGIYEGLGDKNLKLVGVGTVGDFQLTHSHIFNGQQAVKHEVVAVVLPPVLKSHTIIIHGCIPVSSFIEITKVDGAVVYELNGRPAMEVIQEMLGEEKSAQVKDNLSLAITLGEKHGDPHAPYDESAYVNRLILGTNPEDGSVTLFEASFQAGTKVQLMSRDNQVIADSAHTQTKKLLESIRGMKPVFALYIDCAGRCCAFSGGEVEEATIIQDELGQDIPLLGFYSGVEIAPLMGRSRPLDWTGVLTLFTVEDS